MPEPFTVLVMAAGRGTRMRSELPKVLHPVCGKPMVQWVVDAARAAGAGSPVCVVRPGDGVASALPDDIQAVEQRDGEGTGSAVLAARDAAGEGTLVILSGDHPLVSAELIRKLVETHEREAAAATLLVTDRLDPAGYGRIVRAADGSVERIVETKHPEAVPAEELAIREVNVGAYVFEGSELWPVLDGVAREGGEVYLTGVFPALHADGRHVAAHSTDDVSGAMGVNDRAGLLAVDRLAARAIIEAHAEAGVTFLGPDSTRVEAHVEIGAETVVWPGTTLRGRTAIGEGCEIGPATTITDTSLGSRVSAPHCFIVEATVADDATLGPFAYLRPGADIGAGAKVGTFVEVKNSKVGAGAKIPHLSYVGDAEVGEGANLGAGNITANYDGFKKHRTVIGKNARTGVHTSLIAPVTVGEDAYTGAGSVIAEDVPDGALGISRPEQKNVEGYAERARKKRE